MTHNDPTKLTVQVYSDLISPSAKLVGGTLEDITRLLVRPVQAAIAGANHVFDQIALSVAERLDSIPPGRRIQPAANIAGPAMEAARFAASNPTLREMYAKLLATAMDADTARYAHPAFVDIISQLTPDEARLVSTFHLRPLYPGLTIGVDGSLTGGPTTKREDIPLYSTLTGVAGFDHPELLSSYVDNVARLGLVRRNDRDQTTLVSNATYASFTESATIAVTDARFGGMPTEEERQRVTSELLPLIARMDIKDRDCWYYDYWDLEITDFGLQFCAGCVDVPTG
jgi:hypothetical protein